MVCKTAAQDPGEITEWPARLWHALAGGRLWCGGLLQPELHHQLRHDPRGSIPAEACACSDRLCKPAIRRRGSRPQVGSRSSSDGARKGGEALVASNSAGKNRDNFFYNLCNDPRYGFVEFHARTMDNPLLPKRTENEAEEAWLARRAGFLEDLKTNNDPLVYAQEYLPEFVDWSGVALFGREKLLVDNQPVPLPVRCDGVFAVIDTASKSGTDNDATAVTFFAVNKAGAFPLLILDWDVVQIEGAVLETWLPQAFETLEELARLCGARNGPVGAFIEDKNSGTILLQQALRRQMPARAIDSKLTAMGKDKRAISVSGLQSKALRHGCARSGRAHSWMELVRQRRFPQAWRRLAARIIAMPTDSSRADRSTSDGGRRRVLRVGNRVSVRSIDTVRRDPAVFNPALTSLRRRCIRDSPTGPSPRPRAHAGRTFRCGRHPRAARQGKASRRRRGRGDRPGRRSSG
jgi:hypothetical protein